MNGNTKPLFSPVVVAPTYNNDRTLRDILTRILTTGLPLVVVNDGATDQTGQVIAEIGATPRWGRQVTAMSHQRNQGKAAALRTGFGAARRMGHTHAVTIDTDGQHDPEQIPSLVCQARRDPSALVIGVRDERIAGYPKRSLMGRRLSNLMIRIESGVRHPRQPMRFPGLSACTG